MKRYAIIISVEDYSNFTNTPFAHADSELLCHTLTEICDYPSQHTLLLQLSPQAEKRPVEILSEIKNVVNGSGPGDTILFYFAGHGHYSEGRTFLILPGTIPGAYETTALPLDDISKELRQPERACFRIFDSCHSGLDVRGDEIAPDSEAFMRAITHEATGWVTLAACRDDQYSISDASIGHGIFTYYLCEYIRCLAHGEQILPELLKVGIVDKVLDHSKRLGYTQTPTLNASISGNISLASRRIETVVKKATETTELTNGALLHRIQALRSVENVLEPTRLDQMLNELISLFKHEVGAKNIIGGAMSGGEPIMADDIPDKMQPSIVNFVRNQGYQPQHTIRRYEEEYEEPVYGYGLFSSSMYSMLPKQKKKRVDYSIYQSRNLPKSASVIRIEGDGRCVPNLNIVIYVIPLQVAACLFISSYREEWPPDEKSFEVMFRSYKILKPGMQIEQATNSLVPFVVENTLTKLYEYITSRIEWLEKELAL